MFISLSKTIGKFGGFRIGIGKRITSKNAWWMLLIICTVCIFQLMWYLLIVVFWLLYAMCYGIWWCIKKLIQKISGSKKNKYNIVPVNKNDIDKTYQYKEIMQSEPKFTAKCPKCGANIIEDNIYCIKCGFKVE